MSFLFKLKCPLSFLKFGAKEGPKAGLRAVDAESKAEKSTSGFATAHINF
jgi:hypothetical protein